MTYKILEDEIFAHTGLTPTAKLIYAILKNKIERNKVGEMGVRTIGTELGGAAKSTVLAAIQALEDAGLLIIQRSKSGGRTTYQLPKAVQKSDR